MQSVVQAMLTRDVGCSCWTDFDSWFAIAKDLRCAMRLSVHQVIATDRRHVVIRSEIADAIGNELGSLQPGTQLALEITLDKIK